MIPKLTFALDSLDLHISKNLVTNLCWLMPKILTVTGLIFSRLWSLLLSVAMLEQMVFIWFYLVFIWLTGVSCNSAAMAQLRIHEGLVFPQPYTFAIFKSGKIFLNNGPKLSAFENGRLCSANIQVTLTSAHCYRKLHYMSLSSFAIEKIYMFFRCPCIIQCFDFEKTWLLNELKWRH